VRPGTARATDGAAFVIGLACGAAIWLLSPVLTGHAEPWDGSFGAYSGSLVVAGAIGGWLMPGRMAANALGIFVGQALVLLGRVVGDPGSGGLWPLGLGFLAVYSLLALAGAAAGAFVRRRLGAHLRG
jgi:hypothetical protein